MRKSRASCCGNNYLDQVRQRYDIAYAETQKITAKLYLALEKKRALDDYEKKHGQTLAKAASVDSATRKRADSLKRIVQKTLDCPYCFKELGENPHLDHIYPVHMGGLSSIENLIWCCAKCNLLKSNKGLILFIREQVLPLEKIVQRLHALGKHI